MANSLGSTTTIKPITTTTKTADPNATSVTKVTPNATTTTTSSSLGRASTTASSQPIAETLNPNNSIANQSLGGATASLGSGNTLGIGSTSTLAADAEAAEEAVPVAPNSVNSEIAEKTRAYLDTYNTDREQKIRDMYAGNIAAQNAQQQTAYDKNMGALRTAYEANLGNLKTAYDNNSASLKTAYDKNLAQIVNSYQQNLSDAEAYRAGISPRYQETMNALGAEYERQRRNNNMQAAVNGLNTGAGSQMALGQSMAYQANQGNLSRSEQEALNEAERGIVDLGRAYQNQQDILNTEYANNVDKLNREYANQQATYGTTYQNNLLDLKTNYQNKIAEAAANNDYQLAAALLDEYGAQYDRTMQQAEQLAEFGDFSMFASIYGLDAAQQMEKMWSYQNPDLAYNLGRITAEDYHSMTGRYPSGYRGAGYGTNKPAESISDYDLNPSLLDSMGMYSKLLRPSYLFLYGGGRGYSASRDKAYRGAPGYLNTEGEFYVPGYSDPSMNSEPHNQGEADALADRYGWTKG